MTNIFNIDRSSLDDEWAGQPNLFYDHAEELAHAKKDYEQKKAHVDVIRAKTALDIRRDPKPYKIPRLTDKIVEQLVTTDPKVKRAVNVMNEARHRMDILQAAVTALEHRKRALEGLVSLHGQSYFSSPKVKGDRELNETLEKRAVRRRSLRKDSKS